MQTQALLDRLERWEPARVTDVERSTVWKEYVFVCVNGEKRAFERMAFYDRLLRAVVAPLAADARPLAADARRPLVVDYGCGSSLFTRMIAQDFGDGVRTVSPDVCRYAVDFSVARNRVHNRTAEGLVVDDVLAPLPALGAQLILAYAVFEHLPNSIVQIKGLIDALAPGGILIENYSGHSSETPHKSDTFSAYRSRDVNLDALASALTLLHGTLPDKRGGVYGHDAGDRYWIKGPATSEVARAVAAALRREDSFSRRWAGRLARRLGRAPWRALRRAPWRASR
jgi:SAM-dependent methyltransferase